MLMLNYFGIIDGTSLLPVLNMCLRNVVFSFMTVNSALSLFGGSLCLTSEASWNVSRSISTAREDLSELSILGTYQLVVPYP